MILCTVDVPSLEVHASHRSPPPGPVVVFVGTLCHGTVSQAQHAVEPWMVEHAVVSVGVDLSDIDFIDARGVSLLLTMRRRCEEHRVRDGSPPEPPLHVVSASDCARRLLEVCGLAAICDPRSAVGTGA